MASDLETTIYEVSYRIPQDRLYTGQGLWFKPNGCRFLLGLSDFVQEHTGPISFIQTKAVGALVNKFGTVATLESAKCLLEITSPVSCVIYKVNQKLLEHPELVNNEPYAQGWLGEFEAFSWQADKAFLMTAQEYVNHLLDESNSFRRTD
jgi:glycine cleavage system H protein